jgi:putative ABC transport system permease protein
MIRHLLKLVWNRKRSTALLILEITFSFLVLFTVGTASVYFLRNYTQPLGYDYQNVWRVEVDMRAEGERNVSAEQAERMARLLREAKAADGVEAAALALIGPFSQSNRETGLRIDGRNVSLSFDAVSDDYARVMNLKVIRGRWFEPGDDALAWTPVVLDADAAEALYGKSDPIGKLFEHNEGRPDEQGPQSRVIGVIEEYRKDGELSGDSNFVLSRASARGSSPSSGTNILVRLRPGTTAAFEETLHRRLSGVAGDWSLEIRSLRALRGSMHRMQLAPVVIGGVIAAFLVLMVVLGLSGVLWQSVTQRRSELGLRRAIGATAGEVRRQLLLELALITALGVGVGLVVVAQLPILGILPVLGVPFATFLGGVLLAMTLMFVLTMCAGIYPSWLATTIEPADALRAE